MRPILHTQICLYVEVSTNELWFYGKLCAGTISSPGVGTSYSLLSSSIGRISNAPQNLKIPSAQ